MSREPLTGRGAGAALLRHLALRSMRRALPWGMAFGLVVWSSVATFVTAYPTVGQRVALAASLRMNVGLSALFGPMHQLATAWGFTAWRSLGMLGIVGSVWGVLTGAALLRGEEDTGRWDLVLAGATDRRRATASALGAGYAAVTVLWALALAAVALGHLSVPLGWGNSLALATAVVLPAAASLTSTVVCGEVVGTRPAAVRAGAAVFGVSFLLRVVAVATGHDALGWATPLGWADRLRPLDGLRPLPLLLLLGWIAAGAAGAVIVAGRRDVGAGLLGTAPRVRRGMWLLGSGRSFAARAAAPATLGWVVALSVVSSVLGLVSHSVTNIAARSGLVRRLAERLGASDGSRLFLGIAMTLLITAVSLAAAGFAAAMRAEEETGRLELVAAAPLSRARWLTGWWTAAAGSLLTVGTVIGLVLWAATRSTGGGIGVATLLAAGLNVVPAAAVVLGVGVLCLGFAPRLTRPVVYGVVAWSFLVELVGSMLDAPAWLLDFSLLHHVAVAPAAAPRWGTNAALLALALVAAFAGGARFARRDMTAA